eukprot:1197034-Ditylum_brightwellii.AAC.1
MAMFPFETISAKQKDITTCCCSTSKFDAWLFGKNTPSKVLYSCKVYSEIMEALYSPDLHQGMPRLMEIYTPNLKCEEEHTSLFPACKWCQFSFV